MMKTQAIQEQAIEESVAEIDVAQDFRRMKNELLKIGKWKDLEQLMKPRTLHSIFYSVWSLSLLFITTGCIYYLYSEAYIMTAMLLMPVALVVFASRIRALGNQCHDTMHNNIFEGQQLNIAYGRYLLFPLLFYDYSKYVKEHASHHRKLGDDLNDLEKVHTETNKAHPEYAAWKNMWLFMRPFLFKPSFWYASFLGDMCFIPFTRSMKIVVWWIAFACLLGVSVSWGFSVSFVLFWFLARATSYHFVKVFCELCDHYGLEQNSIMTYSRCMPVNFVSAIFHPQNDSYHVTHHIFPNICMPNLAKAHKILMEVEEYAAGEICNSYFVGEKSVINSFFKTSKSKSEASSN